ncbi:MAG: phosphonate ABC transporter ATP-binding protein [Planctomycetota bacterium]|nr:MAG: phosphonate ABC transporter ATP-binding protein [Planctomycetota bacterium]
MESETLHVQQLSKRFGTTVALDAVDLVIPNGQMVGVIGCSGAGKSTLLRTIKHLNKPDSGFIMWQGSVVSGLRGRQLRQWQRNCGMIFQQFNLVPRLDVLTNVLMGRLSYRRTLPSLLKLFPEQDRAQAIRMLERVGLAQCAFQRADTLSGGQQQRVAIARALVQQPALMLADEPIASLDPRAAEVVMQTLARINREDGITVICNLHTVDTARRFCDRIIGMRDGKIIFDDVADRLNNAVVQAIYGADHDESFDESVTSTALTQNAASSSQRSMASSLRSA